MTNCKPVIVDLEAANRLLASLTAAQRIGWATQTFGDGLYALTSAGIDSALMLDHISKANRSIPVIHINTGFLPKETLAFRDQLQKTYKLQLHEFGPDESQIADVEYLRLWDGDLDLYSKITKLDPLKEAINELGISALLSAVRGDQTEHRSTLNFIGEGHDGELRIHPFIDWSKTKTANYFAKNNLPRHPLHKKGYQSVGDWHSSTPGKDRSGRSVMECGLHVKNRKPLKNLS